MDQLVKRTIQDVLQPRFLVSTPDSKTNKLRSFLINSKYLHVCSKHVAVRMESMPSAIFPSNTRGTLI